MHRLYQWILGLAARPRALPALTALSFAESMFFPIPPDVMLIPMCVARPDRSRLYALWCSIGSLVGGIGGYAIGMFLWTAVGDWFYTWVPAFTPEKYEQVGALYDHWNFWVVFTAGFTPIPYKVITITAGAFGIGFGVFMLASAVSRSARFFLVALILERYGVAAQAFIERRFGLVSFAFVALLVAGFVVIAKL